MSARSAWRTRALFSVVPVKRCASMTRSSSRAKVVLTTASRHTERHQVMMIHVLPCLAPRGGSHRGWATSHRSAMTRLDGDQPVLAVRTRYRAAGSGRCSHRREGVLHTVSVRVVGEHDPVASRAPEPADRYPIRPARFPAAMGQHRETRRQPGEQAGDAVVTRSMNRPRFRGSAHKLRPQLTTTRLEPSARGPSSAGGD